MLSESFKRASPDWVASAFNRAASCGASGVIIAVI
jgi:hypothetical protein